MRYVLITLSFFLYALHGSSCATVQSTRGLVYLIHEGKQTKVINQQVVFEEDTIITKRRARVALLFNDGTQSSLGQNTRMTVHNFLVQTKETSNVSLEVTQGSFRFITGNIGKIAPKKFSLQLKNSTIGIRGTDFAGSVLKNEVGVLYLGLGKGVDVKTKLANRLLNVPGDGVFVTRSSVVPHKGRWSKNEVQTIFSNLGAPIPFTKLSYLQDTSYTLDQKFMAYNRLKRETPFLAALANIGVTVPFLDSNFLHAELTVAKQLNTAIDQAYFTRISKLYFNYTQNQTTVNLGLFSYHTPLTGQRPIHINPSLWKGNDTTDWYWYDDTAFLGANYIYKLDNDFVIDSAILTHIKKAESTLQPISNSTVLGQTITSPIVAVLGIQHNLEYFDYSLYDYALRDVNLLYAHVNYPFFQDNLSLFQLQSQYIRQDTNTQNSQMFVTQLNYRNENTSLAFASSLSNGSKSISSPFQANPAYTNSMFNNDTLGTYGNSSFSGPYSKDTLSFKLAAEHIFSFFPNTRFEFSHAWYQQTRLMQESDIAFSSQYTLFDRSLKVGFKYGYISNFNFQTGDNHQYMFITNWHF